MGALLGECRRSTVTRIRSQKRVDASRWEINTEVLPAGHVAVLLVNVVFGDGVERRCRLVQNQNRPVLIQCSGQHQPLGLAAGELHSIEINISAKVGIYTVGESWRQFL